MDTSILVRFLDCDRQLAAARGDQCRTLLPTASRLRPASWTHPWAGLPDTGQAYVAGSRTLSHHPTPV